MNIVICDSQKKDLIMITHYIQECMSMQTSVNNYHIDTFDKSDPLIQQLYGKMYDVAFLETMIDETNGIELAKMIKDENPNCLIVFITEHLQYVSSAFEIKAFQYLLKPIQKEAFQKEFERIIIAYKKRNFKFMLHTHEGKTIMRTQKILYIETYYRHLKIVTYDTSYTVNIKQKDHLYRLLKTLNFIKVQRSYLVNMNNVSAMTDHHILLNNGYKIQTSPLKKEQIIQRFNHFLTQE